MAITSGQFLAFLLGVIVVYYVSPTRISWVVLLAASLWFYLKAGLAGFCYMLFTAVSTYACGLALGRLDKKERKSLRKFIVFIAMVLNFGLLFVIKYVPESGLTLPMGLSYYMFQAAGYVVDMYRKKYEAQKSFLKFLLFLCFFPQVIQGPISRYNQLSAQLFEKNSFNADNLKYGLQLMMWGYLKKLIMAGRVGIIVNGVYSNYLEHGGAMYFLASALSVFQVYCDFSGGIDIISGAAKCMGIDLALNFRRPFFAVSLADYWQRWHITLYTWLRDYLFYPVAFSKAFIKLGEWSRKHFRGKIGKSIPTTAASFVVYFAIGIWHGTGIGYVAFGIFNAAIVTISNLFPGLLKTPKWFSIIRTWFFVTVSEFFIHPKTLRQGTRMLSNVFTNFQAHELFDGAIMRLGLTWGDVWILLIGIAVMVVIGVLQEKGIKIRESLANQSVLVQWIFIFLPLLAIVYFGFASGNAIDAAFIYGAF